MNDEHDDKRDDELLAAAGRLSTAIAPERDLWPGIEDAIRRPRRSRFTPMLAQAAAVVLLVGASSMTTYLVVKQDPRVVEVIRPALTTDTATFVARPLLDDDYRLAHGQVTAQLHRELERLPPETRADVERNLAVIGQAIADINQALEKEPDNDLLQDLLANAYREEVAVMQRIGNLTQQVMSRQDI